MKWKAEHPEAQRTAVKRYRTKHHDRLKERRRRQISEHDEEDRDRYNERRRKRTNEHHEEYIERKIKKRTEHVNSAGVPKSQIRVQSGKILDRIHSKLQGYEIHHCFGYDDPNRFIYIPKNLHTQIHRLLRDNNIPADSDHWNVIRDLVNSCEEYTYIRC